MQLTIFVTDDEPAPPDEVIVYAAGLLGVPPPPAIPRRGRRGSGTERGPSVARPSCVLSCESSVDQRRADADAADRLRRDREGIAVENDRIRTSFR